MTKNLVSDWRTYGRTYENNNVIQYNNAKRHICQLLGNKTWPKRGDSCSVVNSKMRNKQTKEILYSFLTVITCENFFFSRLAPICKHADRQTQQFVSPWHLISSNSRSIILDYVRDPEFSFNFLVSAFFWPHNCSTLICSGPFTSPFLNLWVCVRLMDRFPLPETETRTPRSAFLPVSGLKAADRVGAAALSLSGL